MTPWCNTECGSSPSLLTSTSSLISWIQVERFRAFTFVTSHGILTDVTTEAIVNVAFIYVCRVKIKDNLNKMREKKSILQFPARRGIFASSWETSASRKILQKQGYGFLAEAMSVSNLRFFSGGGGGGKEKVLKKVLFREAPLQGLTLYPFIYHFWQKRYPFCIPSIDKWYPFHIPCLELFIPFNCCKCTVF